MARTYRRKGGEPSWLLDDEDFVMRIWKRNLKQHKAIYHSDAWAVNHADMSWVKRTWAKRRRQWDRQELSRLAKCCEYEPIWFQTQIDTWWWD